MHIIRIDSQSSGPLDALPKLSDALCALKSTADSYHSAMNATAAEEGSAGGGVYLQECAEYLATGQTLDSFGRSKKIVSYTFPETQFIAVTAYQNEDVRNTLNFFNCFLNLLNHTNTYFVLFCRLLT